MALGGLSMLLSFLIVWLVGGETKTPTVGLLLGALPPSIPVYYAYWQIGINLVAFLCFLIVLRLSPLAGFHAAEHMTVTCIERLGYVDVEQVRHMPRAHRRCGTSLLAGVLPALLAGVPLLGVSPELAALVLLVGWVARDQTGYWLQQIFTTKRPTQRQLQAGIAAGQRLLALAGAEPARPMSPVQRLWRRGFPQMAAGAITGAWLLGWLVDHAHLLLDPGVWAR
jgi:hypothetical protein